MPEIRPAPFNSAGSFRDPDGVLIDRGGDTLLRRLTPQGMERAMLIQGLQTVKDAQQCGRWVSAQGHQEDPACLVHARIFFPSYPHEWTPAMLHRAARLTLDLNLQLLTEGWELKDATPANILFQGSQPVFVDHMSPVRRGEGQLGWTAYGQFVRTFLIPLLLHRCNKVPLTWVFCSHRDGLSPETAAPLFRGVQKFHPRIFFHVTLPAWLGSRVNTGTAPSPLRRIPDPGVAATVSQRIIEGLRRSVQRLDPRHLPHGHWHTYQDEGTSYSQQDMAEKDAFVAEALVRVAPRRVLDLGCNTGKYSLMAARTGSSVVALDADPACIERLFLEAEAHSLDVLPLLGDLGRPSPALGWGYQEAKSLWERLDQAFDLTFALALVHHLLVRERIPLDPILDFLSSTTRGHLLLEWIPPDDPQFRRLAGPNLPLYDYLSSLDIEQVLGSRFRIEARQPSREGSRILYLLAKRAP